MVKELVENALDAGARRIDIELQEGGIRLIRIRDDGAGMAPATLPWPCRATRPARSPSLDDLEQVATLGFRGEALPSIASVSRFSISSQTPDAGHGAAPRNRGWKAGSVPAARASDRDHHRSPRPVLQRARAAEIPARRAHRTGPCRGMVALAGLGAAHVELRISPQRQAGQALPSGRRRIRTIEAGRRGARRGFRRPIACASTTPPPASACMAGSGCRPRRDRAPTSSISTSTAARSGIGWSRTRCARPMRRAVPWPASRVRAVPGTRFAPRRRQRASGQARSALPRRPAGSRIRIPDASRIAVLDARRRRGRHCRTCAAAGGRDAPAAAGRRARSPR